MKVRVVTLRVMAKYSLSSVTFEDGIINLFAPAHRCLPFFLSSLQLFGLRHEGIHYIKVASTGVGIATVLSNLVCSWWQLCSGTTDTVEREA